MLNVSAEFALQLSDLLSVFDITSDTGAVLYGAEN